MNRKLQLKVISPLAGSFEVNDRFVIGRDPENDLVLPDAMVSRRHAELSRSEDGFWTIKDLGSSHGTFVDGRRISCLRLEGRGELRVGGSLLTFDTNPLEARPKELGSARVAQRMRVDSAPRFIRGVDIQDPMTLRRGYDKLRVAYELTRTIALEHDAQRLPRRILTAVIELLEADRGALVQVKPDGSVQNETYASAEGIEAMTGFSRTMLAEVLSTKAALICDDAGTDVRFQRSSSMYSAGIRSVMCMPIVSEGDVLGVLEIECLEAARAFDEEDLEIFSVIAAQAGLALRGMALLAERREQEARAAHAERLALVGRLTGGIAHDFNNLMSIVMSYGELIQGDAPPELREDALVIVETARRAAALTRQLLSFSRRDHQRPQNVRLGEVVSGLAPLLRRTLGDPIDVDVVTTGSGLLNEDPGRLEQVLMNLAVNARDAMPKGGKLSIRARDLELHQEERRQEQLISPGRYVELSVADTGTGIPPETLSHIFEPFFTTKERGRGTGLGLATVHGIVVSSGGKIFVDTEPGRGTCFTVLWPQANPTHQTPKLPRRQAANLGTGTILLAEDEDAVREAARRILAAAGYEVIAAPHGEAALSILKNKPEGVALLVTDVTMPKMSGVELAQLSRRQQPELPVLYITGFPNIEEGEVSTMNTDDILEKPFSAEDLLSRVRRAMARPAESA